MPRFKIPLLLFICILSIFGFMAYKFRGITLAVFFYTYVPILILYYINNRLFFNLNISINVIVALVFFNLSDILQSTNIFGEDSRLQFLQILMVFVSQIFYLLEFRKEGAYFIDNIKDNPIKFSISAIVVFVVSGLIFLDVDDPKFYFLLLITSFELFILVGFSIFRPVVRYSRITGIIGVILMFFAESLFTVSYFINKSIPIHVASMILYFVSQVIIVESFVHSKSDSNFLNRNFLNKYIP